jgi:pyruvate/2-oxoglutarate dehydrogenase complex dihydrolipoamide acyltransferase (E2) component
MSTPILVPKLGFAMTEGTLNEWLFAEGASVGEGDTIFLLEAEKSTVEVPAPATGVLKNLAQAGETYEVGTVIGTIE